MSKPSIVALIPARAGSKRLQGKNVKPLAGHPMMAYTIAAARESGIFSDVVVSTDDPEIAAIAKRYGASVPFLRPGEMAGEFSADIEWIRHALKELAAAGGKIETFSILRPTSPFRQAETIRRAWDTFLSVPEADSLRAVELCKQHPGKMWQLDGSLMKPLLDDGGVNPPWHSTAYQGLPPVYAQNASLEIAWSRIPLEEGTIAGQKIIPFLTEGQEGFDINKPEDWWLAELLIEKGLARLPLIRLDAVSP
jgi:N-acylneuraminate cytidylyltransferase